MILQVLVGDCDAFVLAQMFQPRLNHEIFDVSRGAGNVREHMPVERAVAETRFPQYSGSIDKFSFF
jgi:hypothetical protein